MPRSILVWILKISGLTLSVAGVAGAIFIVLDLTLMHANPETWHSRMHTIRLPLRYFSLLLPGILCLLGSRLLRDTGTS